MKTSYGGHNKSVLGYQRYDIQAYTASTQTKTVVLRISQKCRKRVLTEIDLLDIQTKG